MIGGFGSDSGIDTLLTASFPKRSAFCRHLRKFPTRMETRACRRSLRFPFDVGAARGPPDCRISLGSCNCARGERPDARRQRMEGQESRRGFRAGFPAFAWKPGLATGRSRAGTLRKKRRWNQGLPATERPGAPPSNPAFPPDRRKGDIAIRPGSRTSTTAWHVLQPGSSNRLTRAVDAGVGREG